MQPVGKSITGDTVYNLACPNANQYLEWTAQQGTRRTVNKTIQSKDPETNQQSRRTWFKHPDASTYNAGHRAADPGQVSEALRILAATHTMIYNMGLRPRGRLARQNSVFTDFKSIFLNFSSGRPAGRRILLIFPLAFRRLPQKSEFLDETQP